MATTEIIAVALLAMSLGCATPGAQAAKPTESGVCAVECPCKPIPPDCGYRDVDGTFYIHTWPCEVPE